MNVRVYSQSVVFLFVLGLGMGPAAGQCPPSCPIKGGAPADLDCHVEFASTTMRLNFPAFNPAAPASGVAVRCFDGEPGCDTDAKIDQACVFNIDVCLQNDDPQLPDCQATGVTSVSVAGAANDPDLQALQDAIDVLLPTTSNVCTSGQRLTVPLQGQSSPEIGQMTVELMLTTADGTIVSDRLELGCVPYGWPSHGFNHANHRSNPNETTLNSTNAADLEVKWQTHFTTPVTSTPAVGNGFVYATSWDGNVYALNPDDGEIAWTTGIGGQVMSTATLTADGRLLAIGGTNVTCLDALTGEILWQQDVRERQPDHAWSSPQVANGRVFIGISAFTDDPCTPGRLMALDLDTGEPLWTYRTLPPRICENDTAIVCTDDADCGGAACRDTCGAGITATVAVDHSGEVVYFNTVGSFTFPSVGDDASILKLEAATGEVIWKHRLQPTEQFGRCENDVAKDCGTDADCDGGVCQKPKPIYQDFGFLNGPILVDASEGPGGTQALVVSGGKEGTLYALDPDDGSIVWTNEVLPPPAVSAGFGLFNAAVGYADGRFYAALDGETFFGPDLEAHLYAFSAEDGATAWTDEIGPSWGSMALANGVLFVGTGTTETQFRCDNDEFVSCGSDEDCPGGSCVERGPYYVYDAETGTRLTEIVLPAPVSSGASIVDGTVYVGFGVFTAGGVAALGLPTGTATATVTPTGLPAGTATATATPTGLPAGTATATATPTRATGATVTRTSPPVATPTDGPQPTDTPTGPTATAVPPTNTPRPPGGGDADDSCALVPASRVEPTRSLILLIVPAVLLWRRRRL